MELNLIRMRIFFNNKIVKIKKDLNEYIKNEDGAGVIELVLILVVLIGLVLIFKDKIGVLLNNIFNNINSSANEIYNK